MRNDWRSHLLFVCFVAAALWLSGAALAQEETPEAESEEAADAAQAGQPPAGAERMVITARKREESLQEVPLAVSGFDEAMLEGLGVAQTDDVVALAPNVYLTQTPGSAANIGVSIRGIGGAEPLLTRDTGVALYVDGAYIARTSGAVFDLIDLERVEVLRGPQGTLYGRNATGGAVNYISRRPSEEFGFEQTASYGNFDAWLTRTRIDTGEIANTGLKSTFTYLAKNREGYVDDRNASDDTDPGAYDVDAFRIALGWDPVEDFSAFYTFDYSALAGEDALFQLTEINPAVTGALDPTSRTPEVDEDRISLVNEDFHDTSTHRIAGHNLTLDFDYGITNLKSISTYRTWDNTEEGTELDGNADLLANFFFTPTPVQLFAATNEREQHQFSQELQLYGPVGERLDYVTGVYFFREAFDEFNPQQFLVTNLANPTVPPGFGVPVGPIEATTLDYKGDAESWAAFTDWTWTPPVLEDRLKLAAGVRYSRDEKSFTQQSPVVASGEDVWRHVDWQGTASFQFTDAIMGYTRVATGYKSGGFNPRSGLEEAFDEEEVITYELGAKTELFDDRVQLNAAVFYSDYDDLQIDQFIAGAGGAASLTVNAGKANILGFEIEALAQLTDHISGYVNYGWLDMEYDEYEILDPGALTTGGASCATASPAPPECFADVSDEAKFGYRPDQTLSAGLGYTSDPFGSWGLVLNARVDALYVDDVWWHPIDETPSGFPITPFNDDIKEGGYTLFHSSVTLSEIPIGSESHLKLTLWGRNLLDEEYRRSGIDFGSLGFAGNTYGEPRTYGLTATFEY
jgi:iron complex outermembrane receptor protein